ncbi:MAG: hypothetical protein SGBAC_002464 [Bacillariaceae sp.]
MIIWTRREAALVTAALVSNYGSLHHDTQKNALFLGGFLLPASAYEPFQDPLAKLGYSVDILAYNDPILKQVESSLLPSKNIPMEILSKSPSLLLGHSKGARTIAEWMPYWTEITMISKGRSAKSTSTHSTPAVVLIEPVDVVPPGSPPCSILEEDWSSKLEIISRIPTLIVAASYTQTSSRYGKSKNLCAPPGRDARAYYDVASEARRRYPELAAPLKYVEFDSLGHNDVVITSSQSTVIGGCANGPDREKGAQLVTDCIVEWLNLLDGPNS